MGNDFTTEQLPEMKKKWVPHIRDCQQNIGHCYGQRKNKIECDMLFKQCLNKVANQVRTVYGDNSHPELEDIINQVMTTIYATVGTEEADNLFRRLSQQNLTKNEAPDRSIQQKPFDDPIKKEAVELIAKVLPKYLALYNEERNSCYKNRTKEVCDEEYIKSALRYMRKDLNSALRKLEKDPKRILEYNKTDKNRDEYDKNSKRHRL